MINGGDNQTPYLHLNLGTDAVKNRNWAILDQRLYDLARGSIANIPAGGDLTGFYPDPIIKDGAMTPNKIAAGGDPGETLSINASGQLIWIAAPPSTPSGPAGGDLTGTYPNPTIKNGALTPAKIAAGGDPTEILSIDAGGNLVWIAAPVTPPAAVWTDQGAYLVPVKSPTYPVHTGYLTVGGRLDVLDIVTLAATPPVSAVTLHAVQGMGAVLNGGTLWKFDVAQTGQAQPTFLESVTTAEAWGGTTQGCHWNISTTNAGASVPQLRVMVQGDGRTYLPNTLGLRVGNGPTPREMLDVSGALIVTAATAATPADGTFHYTGTKFQGRVGGAWVDIPGVSGFTDAPNDGQLYGRQSLAWAVVPAGGAPTGSAGGDLTGTYPNPTLVSPVPAAKLAQTQTAWATPTGTLTVLATANMVNANSNSVALTLPPVASVTGNVPYSFTRCDSNAANTVTVTPNAAETIDGVAGSIRVAPFETVVLTKVTSALNSRQWVSLRRSAWTTIAAAAPANPVQGQLWWRNDPDGNLFISYNDGSSTQWVPAVPSSAPQWAVAGDGSLTPVDATKGLTLPTSGNALTFGSGTVKGTLLSDSVGEIFLQSNNSFAPQDTSKVSWNAYTGPTYDGFFISRRAAAGAAGFGTNLLSLDATGQLTVASEVIGTGAATTRLQQTGFLSCNNYYSAGWHQDDTSKPGYVVQAQAPGDYFVIQRQAPGNGAVTNSLVVDGSANLTIGGATATKASGTTWANPSDIRIKKNVTDYTPGLDAICALRPIRFEHNGAAGTTDGYKGISFIADEVESVMPEMVGTQRAKLQPDDAEDTELKTLDVSPMLFAFVNAFKEVSARLAKLEAR